jgi:hypothetical protein
LTGFLGLVFASLSFPLLSPRIKLCDDDDAQSQNTRQGQKDLGQSLHSNSRFADSVLFAAAFYTLSAGAHMLDPQQQLVGS